MSVVEQSDQHGQLIDHLIEARLLHAQVLSNALSLYVCIFACLSACLSIFLFIYLSLFLYRVHRFSPIASEVLSYSQPCLARISRLFSG